MLFNKLNVKAIILMLVSVAMAMAATPKIVFVKSSTSAEIVTGDPNTEFRLVGAQYEFYILALNEDDSPCFDCNFNLALGDQTSKGITILSGNEVVNGRATVIIQSQRVYEKCDNPDRSKCGKDTTATIQVVGPNAALTFAEYTNLQFQEPPVRTPLFADIFDVHGEPSLTVLNISAPYYDAAKEYLDGIADSLVIYYSKPFKNHKDSLPDSILVSWMVNDKDSVRKFDGDVIRKGAICGADSGFGATIDPSRVDAEHCLGKITLGGKKLSNDVKTFGTGKVVSWASFTARGVSAIKDYSAVIIDRIAPIILSAKATTDSITNMAQLQLQFSEPVMKTDVGVALGDNVFSFYINNGKSAQYMDYIQLANGVTLANKISETYILLFNMSSIFPQPGDYIHFRSINGTGLIEDQSDYKLVDSIRTSNDAYYNWNTATGFDAINRLPSPWVLIEKMTSSSSTSGKSSSNVATSSNSKAVSSSSSKTSNSERPDFYVKMTGPFEFEIVMDESVPSLAKKYAVMDMKGQVLSVGELNDKNALVNVPNRGAYIVKLGLSYQRVNIR